jgi:putative transposase
MVHERAFDLLELNGDDLRRDLLQVRKATLASIVARGGPGIRFNEHIEGDGPTVFAHACKMGLEGIVSKRKDSAYRSGRSPDWLKMKNVDAPAVKRDGVVCSMSRSGNVWDNAAMESFFSSLKTERTGRKTYRTRDEAKADVFDYIERFYNSKRRHSRIGYMSPMEFDRQAGLA